jgi:Toprim domain
MLFKRAVMADQIVITEKSSQAKDVRAAVGSRYGSILPAEGHLLDLLEPEDVVPEWKRWSPILLRPEGLYGTRPAEGGNKAAKLKAIREALRTTKRVWLATDCDREGQLIGQEIPNHLGRLLGLLAANDGAAFGAAARAPAPTTFASKAGHRPRYGYVRTPRAGAGTARAGAVPTGGGGSMRPATRSSS